MSAIPFLMEQLYTYICICIIEGDCSLNNARMPLYHFATTDLPADTIAPEMDDANATAVLKADARFTGEDLSAGGFVDEEIMGRYLAYLVGIGFVGAPSSKGMKALPEVGISEEQKAALLRVGGRGALI